MSEKLIDPVKEYYKKINLAIDDVNRKEEFKLKFLLALSRGEVKLSHQIKKIGKRYKDDWLNEIEGSISFIENIIYEPKKFIRQDELIVPVELARKTGKESIEHLAANTHLIVDVDDDGSVIPDRILTVLKEEDYAIYENRFLKMLINRMDSFVDNRYTYLTDKFDSFVDNSMEIEAAANLGDVTLTSKIEFGIHYNVEEEEKYREYTKILNRTEQLRMRMFSIRESEFMHLLKDAKPIVGPIRMTNILTKDVNYSKSLDLWYYLNQYEGTGFEIEVTQEIVPFDETYKNDIYNMLLLGYATVKVNSEQQYNDGMKEKITKISTLVPKVDKKFREVTENYIYEEEVLIPTKLELLKNIKEEQERLEAEMERQKELEERAMARIAQLRRAREEKAKKERAREIEKRKREADALQKQMEAKLKEKEEKRKLINDNLKKDLSAQLRKQQRAVNKVVKSIEMYETAISNLKLEQVKYKEQIQRAETNVKKYKELIKKEKNVESNKNHYYNNLFRGNTLKSSLSDNIIAVNQYENVLKKYKEKLERERKIEEEIRKKLKDL